MGYYFMQTIFTKNAMRQEEIRADLEDSHRALLIHMRYLRSYFFEKRGSGRGFCYFLGRMRYIDKMQEHHYKDIKDYIHRDMSKRFPDSYPDGFAFGEERLTGSRQLQAFSDNFNKRLNWIDEMIKDLEQDKC